ncbi:ATP-binding protein [Paracoccus sp. DMF-8]|uniref:ATP-binding protein n=1 Tax=Paracoccus sp. DMF-8 TaxID=3019445 RepID=UPI0023E3E92A|nr:ATP-binding protein [Paracoccus sp. DMF-8]MDF3607746.1 ATP-binding protein [Paracoccus sp. DMF-8]
MAERIHRRFRNILGTSALALCLAGVAALADTLFTATSDGFIGSVSAGGAERGAPVHAGDTAVITGTGLVPGQAITLMRGTTVLNPDGPITVDAEGGFSHELTVDGEALTGLQPIVVIGENPAAATVAELKVSPDLPVSGDDLFTAQSGPVTRGLYQVAYSAGADALYVTSAVGRPPVRDSELLRLDPETLEVQAEATPVEAPAAPGRQPAPADGDDRPGVFAVYGVDVDEANGNVWVTNTRQNTVAVYKQDDLSLVRQYDPGAVSHARDVIVNETLGRAYASATGTGNIEVFDTATLEQLEPIVIRSAQRGGEFSVMSLALDEESGKLVTVSLSSPEAAVVDLASGEARIIPIPGAKSASGVAYDPVDGLIFVASQATDNLLIVSEESGEILHDIETGAGALNVTFEPQGRLAYVSNRGAGTVTVVNTSGEIVANLDGGSLPNHLNADGKGNVFAVNKSRGEDDAEGDRIWRITPVAAE